MESPKLKVKGIIFDLDGTIVDSKEAYLEAIRTAFASLGQRVVDPKMVTEIPKRIEQKQPIEGILTEMNVQRFREIYLKAYYAATASKTKPMPNTASTLEKLSAKAKLGLITMRHVSKKRIVEELESFGLAKYFQCVMTGLDTFNTKPSPEAIIECASRLGVETCECVVVGDSVIDVKAGKNAGAKTVAVLSGIYSRAELEREKPDLILENVNQLPAFIDSVVNRRL